MGPCAFRTPCSSRDREQLRRESGAPGVVGHDRVGDVGPEPERLDRPARARRRPGRGRSPSRRRRTGGRRRAALDSWPSDASIRSAGPFSALPPTIPDTATTRAPCIRASPIAARTPRTARIGPTETIGFDGAMTTRSACADARPSTSRVARAFSMPRNRTSRTSGSWSAGDEVVLEVEPAVVGPDLGPDRCVGHRQDRRRDAEGSLQRATDVGQPLTAPQPRGPGDVRRQVAVAEPEPRLLAVPLEHLGRGERLALRGPSPAPGSRGRRACT